MNSLLKEYEKDLKIGRKIIVILVVVFLFFVLSIALSFRAIQVMAGNNRNVSATHSTLGLILSLEGSLYSAESTQRGFLLTADGRYTSTYDQDKSRTYELVNKISEAKTQLPDQIDRFALLKDRIVQKFNEMDQTILLAKSGDIEAARALVNHHLGLELMGGITKLINDMEAAERVLVVQNQQIAKERREGFLAILVTSNLVALLVTLGTAGLLLRNRNRLTNYYEKLAYTNAHLNDLVRERTAELNQYFEELKRSNQELQNFAFVASHDLQEPLRKIRAFGDRLNTSCADQLNEKGQDYLGRMLSAAERMSVLITDILRYSRVTQQSEALHNIPLDQVLEEALGNLEIAITESAATIDITPLPVVKGDKSQLTQVFSNLLSNSLKFRKADSPLHIKISSTTIDTDDGNQMVEIKFADNGVGFDSKYVGKVFEIFQRLHSKDAFSGTGIGLAVCKKIIERHGGTISADAQVGLGATFLITLPIAPTGALTGVNNGN